MKAYLLFLAASAVVSAFATVKTVEALSSDSSPVRSASAADGTSTGTPGPTVRITPIEDAKPPVPTPAKVLAPLHEVKQTRFDSAHWINTTVDISASGHVDGRIHVWSKHFFTGFTGHALIYLRDAEGNILFRMTAPSIGVNGEGFGRSDVTKTWQCELAAIVREHVARIEIVNAKNPPRPGDLIKQNAESIAAAYKRYAK